MAITAKVHIEGMACNHCKMNVEKALNNLEGITSAEVNLDEKIATITADVEPETLPIEKTINDLGFTFKSIEK